MMRLGVYLGAVLMVAGGSALVTQQPVTAAPPLELPKQWDGRDPQAATGIGSETYKANCAGCHDAGLDRAPQLIALQDMTPEAISRALTTGVMRAQGAALTPKARIAVSEFVAGRKMGSSAAAASLNMCKGARRNFDLSETPVFSNWGLDASNSHAIPASTSGLTANNVKRLKLKWTFAFANSSRARSQPALAAGAIIVGNHNGTVYALDRETGCTRWAFAAEAEVRTGIVVSPWQKGDKAARPLVYFGDLGGNVYAVRLLDGRLAWKTQADKHPAAIVTGTPSLYGDKLYVPVSSNEETFAASPGHACCTFRGSVVALDAKTGSEKWRTWLVDPAVEQGIQKSGLTKFGPSGVAVWNSPAIDPKRGQLYIGTGDNYSAPATGLSDAVIALDLATGKIKWHHQVLGGDAWNLACMIKSSDNCPDEASPDFDFGAGTILAKSKDGRELVLAGQKSGGVYAFDPTNGTLVWTQRIGRGGPAGGVLFGMAAENGTLFVPMSDRVALGPDSFQPRPGLFALDIGTGKTLWEAPDTINQCTKSPLCLAGYSGVAASTAGLVLIGSDDGHIRVYDGQNGQVLWQDNTIRSFTAVNGLPAKGGSISGAVSPLAYQGQLIIPSGYSYGLKTPGNVLLVYGID